MVKKLLSRFKKAFQLEQFELCVVCRCHTNVPVNMNVDQRHYYVECAGQLCKECYNEILNNHPTRE